MLAHTFIIVLALDLANNLVRRTVASFIKRSLVLGIPRNETSFVF